MSAALIVACVALLLAANANLQAYRIIAALRRSVCAVPPLPAPPRPVITPGMDAATAMQAALDNAPGMFEEARRQQAAIEAATKADSG